MDFYVETLGCPKNEVDSQAMARELAAMGHRAVEDPRRADALIVNTCGFVEDARRESLAALRRLVRAKRKGQWLVAAGCLPQYWGESLSKRVPGIDALIGTRRWSEIGALLGELEAASERRGRAALLRLGDPTAAPEGRAGFARQGASAYLKIADGCSAPCTFCAIPLIKGPAASRPVGEIAAEAASLVQEGVREIVLIAQDTTAYGRDRGETDSLPGLIDSILHAAPGLTWLRLMYAYPGHATARLIERMAADRRICHYLDLPLQHAHPAVLRRMMRPADVDRTRRLIDDLRAAIPDLALRSTFIVGFPGETDAEFEALVAFLEEMRFDHAGVFCYSLEEGTAAAALPGAIPEPVKTERREWLMGLQQQISRERNVAQIGRTLEVLVEGQGDGLAVGRTYRDSPEVDGLVFFPGEVDAGAIVPVQITGAAEYDLFGEALRDP
ncbi:MAG TPA: 30S ribosomal protein S12 methylthiotransferase RimO [Anaerolineae bacterium]|nr:30S ribosomal protein S12 methylthiotransferase RimO [Anaerolineae bacterium]